MTDEADARSFPYDVELLNLLLSTVESYEEARSTHHEIVSRDLGPEIRSELDRIDMTANLLVRGIGDLAARDFLPRMRRFLESWKGAGLSDPKWTDAVRLLKERVAIHIGHEACKMMQAAEERFDFLLGVCVEAKPSQRTLEFLRRVSRCFLFGFDVECVVMCRAAIEAELQAMIPADDCVTVLGSRPRGRDGEPLFDLADRIHVAQRTGRFTNDGAEKAREIKRAGNDAIHRRPVPAANACGVIVQTLSVLKELDAED